MKKFVWIVALLITTLGFTQSKYSVLTGKVTSNGAPLPGVTLNLTGPNLMGQRSVVTDANGVFRFTLLPPGQNYVLNATMQGFQPFVRKNISLPLGKTITINFDMKEAQVSEEIIVTAEAPLIDTTSNEVSTNLRTEFVQTLTNDRQFQMVMAMVPGAIEGNNPSMLGGAATDNVYLVDGADTTDPLTHTWGNAMNFDTLEEIQVVTGGVSAEYGRGQGAVVNLVTKSGGNEYHGNFRFIKSDVAWNSEANGKPFDEATKYTTEDRWAMTLGGPIIKDKLWFFASYEKRDKQKQTFHYANLDDYLVHDPALQKAEAPSYAGHYFSLKLTWQITENHSVMVMYNEDPITFPLYSYLNYDYYEDPFAVIRHQGGEKYFFEWNWVISDDSFLTFKFQDNSSPLSNLPRDGQMSTMDVPVMRYTGYLQSGGVGSYYTGISAPTANYDSKRDFQSYKLAYSKFLDTSFGGHDISAGLEYRDSEYGSRDMIFNGGNYMRWREDRSSYGGYFLFYDDQRLPTITNEDYKAIYVQDKWSVTDRLTVTLGLRADDLSLSNVNNVEIVSNKFGDMLAPRIGFAYDLDGDSIHASYARYYDAIGDWVVRNSQPGQQYTISWYYFVDDTVAGLRARGLEPWNNLSQWQAMTPEANPDLWYFAGTYTYGPEDGSYEIIGSIDPSYMDEYTLGYEWQVSPLYALGFNYVHREWKDAYEDKDDNQDGVWEFLTVDGTWREYDALIFTAQKKLAEDGFQFLFSYTYSRTEGYSASDNSTGFMDTPYQFRNYYGRVNDVPHVIKFNGSYKFDFGLLVGLNYILSSGVSYTPTITVENLVPGVNQGYDYDVFVERRGSRRMPGWSRADLHVEYGFDIWKDVNLSLYADIFNVFNTRSTWSIISNLGYGHYDTNLDPSTAEYAEFVKTHDPVLDTPRDDFGEATEWQFPRSFYLGFNIQF